MGLRAGYTRVVGRGSGGHAGHALGWSGHAEALFSLLKYYLLHFFESKKLIVSCFEQENGQCGGIFQP